MINPQTQPSDVVSKPIPYKWIWCFCLATFFFWASLYLYQPILAVYAKSIDASLSMIGIIVAAYALPQFLFRIEIGVWYDNTHRKKPLIISGFIMAVIGALGLALAPDAWWLFGARAVTGIGAAGWVAMTTWFAAYYSTGAQVKRSISLINFVQAAAMVVGTYSGGLIAQHFSYGYTFYGAAVLALVGLGFLMFSGQPEKKKLDNVTWHGLKSSLTSMPLLTVCLMGVLSQFANWSGLFGFVPVYASGIGATSADLGMINMISLAASALASLVVVRMTKWWGNSFTILLGSILIGGAIMVVPLIHDITVLKGVMLLNGIGRGLLTTILMLLSIQGVRPEQRATSMGIFQALYALGMLLGPLVSGFMAEKWGISSAFYLSAVCCAATAAIAYLPVVRYMGRE
jgi:predicted MFS family arabinose efflux permease